MRERLIELYHNIEIEYLDYLTNIAKRAINDDIEDKIQKRQDFYVDKLLENGVIVPPCKVGEVVYAKKGCFYLPHATRIKADDIITCEIIAIKETKKGKFLLLKPLLEEAFNMRSANDWFSFLAIGKTVFLTKEEAEQALKGGEG